MSTALGDFNAMNVKPATMGGSAIPVSDNFGHLVIIYDDETLPSTKDPNNGVLNLKVKIIEGEHNGLEGVYRINYFFMGQDQNSITTKRIADAQLSAICHAVNVYNPKTVAELYNKPFRIVVELQKGEEAAEKGYTQIKGVLCADGGIPGFPDKPKVVRQGVAPAAVPGTGVTPWQPQSAAQAPVQPEAAPAQPASAPWGQPATPAQEAAQGAAPWGQPAATAGSTTPPWGQRP